MAWRGWAGVHHVAHLGDWLTTAALSDAILRDLAASFSCWGFVRCEVMAMGLGTLNSIAHVSHQGLKLLGGRCCRGIDDCFHLAGVLVGLGALARATPNLGLVQTMATSMDATPLVRGVVCSHLSYNHGGLRVKALFRLWPDGDGGINDVVPYLLQLSFSYAGELWQALLTGFAVARCYPPFVPLLH